MNRPFGAGKTTDSVSARRQCRLLFAWHDTVDVCANLKGAVQKTTTQKIMAALAEKGEITQKAYGKSHDQFCV